VEVDEQLLTPVGDEAAAEHRHDLGHLGKKIKILFCFLEGFYIYQ
jgi:hypothetical protein